jgi:hypothetical protein
MIEVLLSNRLIVFLVFAAILAAIVVAIILGYGAVLCAGRCGVVSQTHTHVRISDDLPAA